MMRYEYRTLSFQHAHGGHNPTPSTGQIVDSLNALGAEGWSLHAAASAPGVFLLEREIENKPDPAPSWDQIGKIGGVSGKKPEQG